MRIVTWNVNSLRARLERVEDWLTDVQPDVVCLQETKLADDAFPALTFEAHGYETVHYGQGQWNGVAILSKVGIADVVANFADGIEPDPDARIITATCGGVRVSCCYVPNGRSLDDDHYTYKLSWLDRLLEHVGRDTSPDHDVIVTGDFNIAPEDRDVYDIAKFENATHVSVPERERLAALCDWGLTDLFRRQHADAERVFSWWDYRNGDFHKGNGLRIDLVLGSASVAERCEWSVVDRNARKGKQPSDHAPVIVDLRD
ncbi:MAG: exodeoxyribonuclease III [Ilumatobacter sp.]|uniref:exodeoxyribonuclease III n=1 Tax=Ilumatobacter sp. TaxID=1967498 RepID=UPI0026061739|nr:exodeoxyribonuclease III [Ilumatobacter sp.]MDJ0768893.1 exodeoxyribonuclease III [Ilumatobacter sp.]